MLLRRPVFLFAGASHTVNGPAMIPSEDFRSGLFWRLRPKPGIAMSVPRPECGRRLGTHGCLNRRWGRVIKFCASLRGVDRIFTIVADRNKHESMVVAVGESA